jgi:hypothetical protein
LNPNHNPPAPPASTQFPPRLFVGPSLACNPYLANAVGITGAIVTQHVWSLMHDPEPLHRVATIQGRRYAECRLAHVLESLPFIQGERCLRQALTRLCRRGVLTKARLAGSQSKLYSVNTGAVARVIADAAWRKAEGRRRPNLDEKGVA